MVGRKVIGIGDGSIGEPKDLDLFRGLEFADFGDEGFGRVGILEDQDEVRAELKVEDLTFELGDTGGFGDGGDGEVLMNASAEFGGDVRSSIVIEVGDIKDSGIGAGNGFSTKQIEILDRRGFGHIAKELRNYIQIPQAQHYRLH